ncbi:Heterogeneous nuclear ribonucleoprotein 1 [Vitis vinifera]|uniref:Heterogeneous nuclear ribonucleoprotein 1 n=1 Tax=Vitis vinifera TaxID=29760 RepID=A0A438IWR1_VITVI|nr:Heterogeneous nuclear ribonucleoprotein 1 [Vitis vinifera]
MEQVEIKRTIPKGSGQSKDFKTKKIFVGGLPSTVTEDEFKDFFSKYGKVEEHQIIRDHETNRSRGFGFIIFESEEVVDEILSEGNMIDMAGTQVSILQWSPRNKHINLFSGFGSNFRWRSIQVEIKKAEPKKASNPPHVSAFGSNSRARSFSDGFGGFGSSYGSYDSGFGAAPYRAAGGLGSRLGGYGGYGSDGGEYGGGYGSFGSSNLGGYRGDPSLGYSSRFGPYGGGFSGSYGGSGLGGYGQGGESYGNYGGSGYASGYDSGAGASYGGAGGLYGRGGYSGSSRYHPYAR